MNLATLKRRLLKYSMNGIESKNWYKEANQEIVEFCERHDLDVNLFIDAMAITSPKVSVKRNIFLAVKYCTEGNIEKYGILPTVLISLANYEKTGKINGNKTRNFSNALKLDENALTHDVWMARVYNIEQPKVYQKRFEATIYKAYKYVQKKTGLTFAEIQACAWSGIIKETRVNVPAVNFAAITI